MNEIDKLLLNKGVAAMLPPKEEKKKKHNFGFSKLFSFLKYDFEITFNFSVNKRR
jgi:hypothetical protein